MLKPDNMRRKVYLIVIGILLFSALAASVHHHADNRVHDDCPVCVAAEHSPAVSNGSYIVTVSAPATPLETRQKALNLPATERTQASTRAPPVF